MITQIGGSVARKLKGEMQTAFTDENIDYTVGLQVVDPFQGYIYENEEYFPEPQAVPFETQFFPDELAAGKWKKQKKWATKRDVKDVTDSVNNLHTKREAIEWRTGLKVTDPLQLYTYNGVEYLPDANLVPFTTSNSFANDVLQGRWGTCSILTRLAQLRDNWDIRGWGVSVNNSAVENTIALNKMLSEAPSGGKIRLPVGTFRITQIIHPDKPLHWFGQGIHHGFKSNTSGTVIEGTLSTLTPIISFTGAKPTTDVFNSSRFSSLNSLTVHGNGVDDNTGSQICIKINNQGLNLNNVTTKYGDVGVECNTSTGQRWENCTFTAKTFAVWFRYDPSNPYNNKPDGELAWATANVYDTIRVHTSTTNKSAVGWLVEATCSYGQNTHINCDFESCYVGSRFEGRRADRDYIRSDGSKVTAYGAVGWQGAGNRMIGCWWERNTSHNIDLSNDVGERNEARMGFDNIFQDSPKVLTSNPVTANIVSTPTGLRKLTTDTKEDAVDLSIGEWGTPLSAQQALINGAAVNTPVLRSLVREGVPLSGSNRSTTDYKSTYEFSCIHPALPDSTAAVLVAKVDMFSNYKNAIMKVQAVATGNTGSAHVLDGSYLISNTDGNITMSIIREDFNTTRTLRCIATETGKNEFGIYIHKENVGSALRATFDIKIVLSGDNSAGYSSSLTKVLSI